MTATTHDRADAGATRDTRLTPIMAHLTRLLNTREGSCLLDPSYGLPDLTDFTHGTASELALLSHVLSERVTRHEPRLRKVSVHAQEHAKRPPRLRFELRAQLGHGERITLSAVVEEGGRIRVRPAWVHP